MSLFQPADTWYFRESLQLLVLFKVAGAAVATNSLLGIKIFSGWKEVVLNPEMRTKRKECQRKGATHSEKYRTKGGGTARNRDWYESHLATVQQEN